MTDHRPHRWLYVADERVLDGVLVGRWTRAEFERDVRARAAVVHERGRREGLPVSAISACHTRWSRVWVVQLGGDRRTNTVVLAGQEPFQRITVTLPTLHPGYEPVTPLRDLGRLLDVLEADYSPGTPTRALVDALTAVLKLWQQHRQLRHDGVPLAQLDRAVSDPLRPLLAAWLGHNDDRLLS